MPRLLSSLIAGVLLASVAPAQSTFFLIDKAVDYSQTDTSTTAFNASIGHSFIAQVADQSGTYNAGNPASAPSVDDNTTTWNLAYNSGRSAWYYESSGHADQATLDATYADTNYDFNFNGSSATVAVSNDLYSNVPVASMNTRSWSSGTFMVNASSALTISSNTFTTNYLDNMSRIEIRIDGNGNSFSQSANNSNSGNSLSLNLNAFDLTSGLTYRVEIGFTRFDGTATMLTGTDTIGSYTTITTFDLSAVPEPSSWSLIVGVLAMGFAGARRRSHSVA